MGLLDRIPNEAMKILHSLASQWSDVLDSRAMKVVPIKGAFTNEVFEINWPAEGKGEGERGRKVLVRIYGEGVDVFFDREYEIRTFELMSRHGQGPRLLGRFHNGRFEEFIHARGHCCTMELLDRIPKEARKILHSLASEWSDVLDSRAIKVVPLKGALTNEVFEINWPEEGKVEGVKGRKVLVRIYGEGVDVFFDREYEIRTFELMSRHGQGPRLLGRFHNGRIEEFIHARTLSATDLRDPEISALIASKLREFNDIDMPGSKKVHLWDRLRNWLKAAKSLCPAEQAKEFCLDSLGEEISFMEKLLAGDDLRIGFCHNDLQYGNIMMDEETKQITIIDYEYASFNPVAYDIANHFCEMAADYHSDTPHVLDYMKYPDLEERKRFVREYLKSSGEDPSEVELEDLLESVEKYALVGHLIWGLWGIISEQVNEIDFDYADYARQRFEQYWLRKPIL